MGIDFKGLSLFFLCSLVIMLLSRNSLRDRHSHGYYRFFGLEFILLLVLGNMELWFVSPFSPVQIVSWFTLILSLILAVEGFRMLGFRRALGKEYDGPAELVRSGPYRYIRHPLYASLLLLALGTFLKGPSLFTAMLLFGATFSINTAAKAEETANIVKFGDAYREYMKETKMYAPYVI